MSQEILNRLAILFIEQDLLENIEYKILISNFVAEIVKSNFSMIFFFKDRMPRFFAPSQTS
jgi:glycerol-3-phosphate O-acyltransferase